MNEDQRPIADCRGWRRTERRTRAAKEIELEVRRRERQRERRFSSRGDGFDRDRLRCLPVLPLAAQPERPSYR
ncbi:hypothetical protein [Catenulispora pinisilvae]|uniref:hypothetical protein n=1 Tax=Catenulispora pinisilvae TaxID=2705253 RepID=UPI001891B96B|nr:hypothetical protein [Catenulispora pinisilvae]